MQPYNTLSYYWRAMAQMNLGDYAAALRDMNESQNLDSIDPVSLGYCAFWRGVTCTLMGHDESAERELQHAMQAAEQITEENQRWRLLAILALFQGDVETARAEYERVLEDDPRANKLFSPRFYLLQLSRLFPDFCSFQQVATWFEAQVV
jgi:tetratricopeptide (TPR) repeat protein